MLIRILHDLNPNYVVACYDLPDETHRHVAYEQYKAGRKKAEPDLISQIKRSYDLFKAFDIPAYFKAGFEADDILGTIVEKMKKRGDIDIIIASGDMDTLQLVDDKKVQVYTLKKGISDTILYDEEAVKSRFGFGPEFLPDYKGLRGDASDNIIGISGIGEKTATELIQKFGSIENIYKSLKKNEKQFEKSAIKPRIVQLLKDGEEEAVFSKMLATIRCDADIEFTLPKKDWKESLDIEKVSAFFKDLEFRTLIERVRQYFVAMPTGISGSQGELGIEVKEAVLPEKFHETAIALWLLNSNLTNPTMEDVLQFAGTKSFSEARETILKEIEKKNLSRVYKEIELPLMPIVHKMEERGIRVDKKYLKNLSEEYHAELAKLEKKIWQMAGSEFNLNSPKQMGEILFDKLQIKIKSHKKTSLGAKSTKESELEKMRGLHPVIDEILKHRELQKLLSTYIDNIPQMLKDDRLHATFLQTGTTTGRMSSNNPNLQNIPIKSELGRKIRKAFLATEGFKLASFDYSQIELRVAAFLSKDEKLLKVFRTGGDIHTSVASNVFGVPPEKVDKEMRRKAKVINFGIIYGMGVNALKANLGTTREEAQKFYNDYFATYTGLAKYLENVKSFAERNGYTETFFGRRRYFEGINSDISYIKSAVERMAINAPIQGTEADIVKLAMIKIDEYLKANKLETAVFSLLQVHDELVYEIKSEKVESVAKEIQKIMESVVSPKDIEGVVCTANVLVGDNWGDLKAIS